LKIVFERVDGYRLDGLPLSSSWIPGDGFGNGKFKGEKKNWGMGDNY
jgi:hypothetical protein